MLEIKANKTIYFEGEKLDLGSGTINEFLMSCLSCPIILDKDLILGDLFHVLYDIKDFINLYCLQEYEVGRVLVSAGRMSESFDYLKIFKNAEVTNEGFLKINVKSELCSYEDRGRVNSVCNLKLVFDENIVDGDEVLREGAELKADFTLLELIEVLYEDFVFSLKQDNILI